MLINHINQYYIKLISSIYQYIGAFCTYIQEPICIVQSENYLASPHTLPAWLQSYNRNDNK